MSPDKRVSSAAANNLIRIIFDTCNRGRWAANRATNSPCRSHHRAVHRAGDEQAWWKAAGIDPVKVARQLWRQTRLNDPQEHHPADLAARPKAQEGTAESRFDQLAQGRADDGRTP